MFAAYYPTLVVLSLSAFAAVLLFVSVEDGLKKN